MKRPDREPDFTVDYSPFVNLCEHFYIQEQLVVCGRSNGIFNIIIENDIMYSELRYKLTAKAQRAYHDYLAEQALLT